MDQASRSADFGTLLRRWRSHRGKSQLMLSLDAGVSTRHLSWLESGKAAPSRAMVMRLAHRLDLPLRERNAMLVAAGFAPLYAERPLADPALAPAREALQRLLEAHEPSPALAVDRHWNLVACNRLVPPLLARVAPELAQPPVNVLRLSLHPQGLAPTIGNLARWRRYVLQRLRRQLQTTGDPALAALLDELQALPPPAGVTPWPAGSTDDAGEDDSDDQATPDVAVPLALHTPHGPLNFISALTVFGAPRDVTLAELAVETLLPADEATATALRAIQATLPAR